MSKPLFRSAVAALATVFLISSVAPPALAEWERDRGRDRSYHDGRDDWRKDGRRNDGRHYDRDRRSGKHDKRDDRHGKTVVVVPGYKGLGSPDHRERSRTVYEQAPHKHVQKKVVVEHRDRDYRPHHKKVVVEHRDRDYRPRHKEVVVEHRYRDYRPHHKKVVVEHRYRDYRPYRPHRPHRHVHRHYHGHDSAFAWLAFTAISIKLIDALNDSQQYEYERAYLRASQAPIGQPIVWNQGGASGTVVAIRDGVSTAGRYCREYQQTVTVGNRVEQGYGTACQQPDGDWQIVSSYD